MSKKREKDHSKDVRKSAIDLSPEKRADVLLALGNQVRVNINQWESRAFTTGIWSMGIMFGVLSILVSEKTNLANTKLPATSILLVVMILFAISGQIILAFCQFRFSSNEPYGHAVREGLRLLEKDIYFKGEPFYSSKKSWGLPWHIIIIEIIHALVAVSTIVGTIYLLYQ